MVLEAQGGRWSLPTGGPAWLAYDFCLPDAADGTGWTPPRRPWCARVVVLVTTEQETSVSEASTIGLDLAQRVFQAHGADAAGKVVFRKRLRREHVLAFFAGRPSVHDGDGSLQQCALLGA